MSDAAADGDARACGLAMMRRMMPEHARAYEAGEGRDQFGSELTALSIDAVFGGLWARPGLDPRSRSLVTLGILIALRAEAQIKNHVAIALRLGISRAELEEVFYHASGYAGFPAAAAAIGAARSVID